MAPGATARRDDKSLAALVTRARSRKLDPVGHVPRGIGELRSSNALTFADPLGRSIKDRSRRPRTWSEAIDRHGTQKRRETFQSSERMEASAVAGQTSFNTSVQVKSPELDRSHGKRAHIYFSVEDDDIETLGSEIDVVEAEALQQDTAVFRTCLSAPRWSQSGCGLHRR